MTNQTESICFFGLEENKRIITACREALNTFAFASPNGVDFRKPLAVILSAMTTNPEDFDKHCQLNLKLFGSRFIESAAILSNRTGSTSDLEFLASTAYRFLCELEISKPQDLHYELQKVREFFLQNLESLPELLKQNFVYANYTMPTHIVKNLINHPNIEIIESFNKEYRDAEHIKNDWLTEIDARKKEVDQLKEAIKDLNSEFNFVGLVNGFKNLSQEKESEIFTSFLTLIILGFVMLLPVASELTFIITHREDFEKHKGLVLYTAPALLAIEVLLLYFFRIILGNFKSAKSQLQQIKLRMSLCQFIQSYTEYSQKIKKADPEALNRFESLIFSSIVADDEKIPATFDGIDQIANLVKSLKAKSD